MTGDPADVVFEHGRIELGAGQLARSLAVRAGCVVALDAAAEALIGPATRRIELGGRTALPGLIDGHAHLMSLGRAGAILALGASASEAEACAQVAAATPEAGWIQGRGWDQNRWQPAAWPTRASLDAAAPGVPVLLRRVDGHAAWLSSAALARAGVTRATADPPGGLILRDPAGEPTGVLIDNAMELATRVVPAVDAAARERWILAGAARCLSRGLVAVHDMGMDEATAAVYRALALAGRLPIRVYGFVDDLDGAVARALGRAPEIAVGRHGRFTLRGIKLYADGALGSRGAWLLAPYDDEPGTSGLQLTGRARIEQITRAARTHGWQIAVHAIGDRANREVLDAYQAALADDPTPGARRLRIEHAQIVAPEDVGRFAALGVIAAMQPSHATSDMPWANARLGTRAGHGYRWRELLDSGAHLGFGSDFPIEDEDPLRGLYAAVTRQDAAGQPPGGWFPAQRLDWAETLAAFTQGNAYAACEETTRGRLAPGYAADLTVLDRAVTEPFEILACRVWLTVVDGEVAYAAPGL